MACTGFFQGGGGGDGVRRKFSRRVGCVCVFLVLRGECKDNRGPNSVIIMAGLLELPYQRGFSQSLFLG